MTNSTGWNKIKANYKPTAEQLEELAEAAKDDAAAKEDYFSQERWTAEDEERELAARRERMAKMGIKSIF